MFAPTYVRSGRGGAGNFAPKAAPKPVEVEMKTNTELQNVDLEAQKPTDPADATSVLDAPGSTPAPQYKTYARGGAGNWYEPATLKQTGTFENSSSENVAATGAEKRSSRIWQGRGGAGNWEADQQIQEEIKRKSQMLNLDEESRAALRDIKEEVRVEVEKEIKPPQSAHVHVPHLDRHQNLGDEVHDI
ncbi:hypothetical protein H072_4170 [Dactylellina haptotyla CBS 200.50]|uniref:Uncharacterized protein n=1 Tax=Dactylellina haptotyla (strain CBS 200.50) TaxID=1284197 RepID=S8BR25_DACHA|nr:hypothetical protein H072_4170 [Dactylellina haptotyla CBS 200.50]